MLIIPWHVTFRFLQSILSCKQYNFRIFSLLYLVFPRYMKITLESFTYLLRWILHLKYKKVIMCDMCHWLRRSSLPRPPVFPAVGASSYWSVLWPFQASWFAFVFYLPGQELQNQVGGRRRSCQWAGYPSKIKSGN